MFARNAHCLSEETLPFAAGVEEHLDIEAYLAKICDFSGGKYAAYHLARGNWNIADSPIVKTNYPANWVQRYLTHDYVSVDPVVARGFDYVSVDPVVARGFTSALPFYWDELELRTPAQQSFFNDALNHGLGHSGLSIPLTDKSKRRALFSISSDFAPEEWRVATQPKLPVLIDLAYYLHQHAHANNVAGRKTRPHLSPREMECLSWIAKGKDTCAIAVILGLSEQTVRDYLKSGRYKLGCSTLAHAVHKATIAGLLNSEENQSP
jgi:DNA-binding CsgD family transcriptional regulator